jgi:hypothetical protein
MQLTERLARVRAFGGTLKPTTMRRHHANLYSHGSNDSEVSASGGFLSRRVAKGRTTCRSRMLSPHGNR